MEDNPTPIVFKKKTRFRRVHFRLLLLIFTALVILAAIIFAAFKLFDRKDDNNTQTSTQTTASQPSAETIAKNNKNILAVYTEQVNKATTNAEKAVALQQKASAELSVGDNKAAVADSIAAYNLVPTYANAYQVAYLAKETKDTATAKQYIAITINKLQPQDDPAGMKIGSYQDFQKGLGS